MTCNGKIFYILGKSASGKDHIYQGLLGKEDLKEALDPLVIYTTRPMREGEKNGREYYFTDEDGLKKLRDAHKVIEERCYSTVSGPWYYFTADEGQIDTQHHSYIGIGTLESYGGLLDYFGRDVMVPIYIESDDGERLRRAIRREEKQASPQYAEVCRRFLADERDFSPANLRAAGIERVFRNDGRIEDCISEVADYIRTVIK